ncbi:Crp/Fnr family transcriptional regulator [Amycolatopsis cynarae]|uniref:Crp/Fnr family transcriptional regulator n=1 Tax=Amycolatopsis cynarae TaxID=2995223 RepID=A0ABY7B4E4_9PSEU|nr:Crp/Fnr family transcriptional regulator [Amycolatopsis sp. HUAS 11-8]WAL66807.1 Crp/Fnr family transcriptional regulator [Amycolatopsis sp. HUAS 11-8]
MVLVESGSVKVVLSEHNGAQVIAGPYGPGELIGELGVLDQRPRSATVIAHRDGTGVRVVASIFRRLVEQDHDVLVLVNATLRDRLHRADRRQLAIASQDVTTRVAAQLLTWADTFGEASSDGVVVRGIPQGDLAKAVVASAKSVDAALKVLRAAGLVRTRRLWFLLPDPTLLRDLLNDRGWRKTT